MANLDQQVKEALAGDTAFVTGTITRVLIHPFIVHEEFGLLVRSKDGSYYWFDPKTSKIEEIHGVLKTLREEIMGRYRRMVIGLVTDSGVINLFPDQLHPTKIRKNSPFYRVNTSEEVMKHIKERGELPFLTICPICGLSRPVAQGQCSNIDCVIKLVEIREAELKSKRNNTSREAQVSFIVGGLGGALAGLVLLLLVFGSQVIFHMPSSTLDQVEKNWKLFLIVPGVIGYLGMYIFLISEKTPKK